MIFLYEWSDGIFFSYINTSKSARQKTVKYQQK